MDALVMCGGRGTRLDADAEKPLFEVGGRPMVDSVCQALAGSRVERTFAAVSPHAPETRAHVERERDLPLVETPGEGYVPDLERALADDRVEPPVLTAVADLPLLAPEHANDAIARHGGASLTVCVPAALKRLLGASVETTLVREGRELVPVGLNVVVGTGAGGTLTSYDARLAVNVNRRSDAEIAEALL